MLRRPSLRASFSTVAAAVVLVGGAGLASYAASGSGHGHGAAAASSQTKTIKFHLGSPGKTYHAGNFHLFSAKVPKGTYELGMSGLILDSGSTGNDSYSCLVADKRNIQRVLGGTGNPNYSVWYALDGDVQGGFKYGVVNYSNNAQNVVRSKIAFGCGFTGDGTFTVGRTITFTLRPVKVSNQSGTPIPVNKLGVHELSRLLTSKR